MTTATATQATCECYKCSGTGYIAAFAGIANGECFRCAGTGRVKAGKASKVKPMTDYQLSLADKVMNADLSTMGYGELLKLRDFSHWPYPQMPNLLTVWRERGEAHFQAKQAEKIAAYR